MWLNPAGLGAANTASVGVDVSADNPGAHGRLRQVTAGIETRGLAFAYQRDLFDAGVRGHTYRVGAGAGYNGFAAGVAMTLYRGDTKGTGWDAGAVYRAGPARLGGTIGNIGQPVVRGTRQRVTFVPGVTLRTPRAGFSLSALARYTPDSAAGYAAGIDVHVRVPANLGLMARIDTDHALRRTAFTFGLSIGARDMLGTALTTRPGTSGVAVGNLYGLSTRKADR